MDQDVWAPFVGPTLPRLLTLGTHRLPQDAFGRRKGAAMQREQTTENLCCGPSLHMMNAVGAMTDRRQLSCWSRPQIWCRSQMIKGTFDVDIKFGADGNSKSFAMDGWSRP